VRPFLCSKKNNLENSLCFRAGGVVVYYELLSSPYKYYAFAYVFPGEPLPSTTHQVATTMTPKDQPSRLLALPAELRVKIWDHVLTKPKPLRPVNEPGRAHESSAPKENLVDVSLLLTNRLIHDEASERFYRNNKFRYEILEYGLFKLRPNPSHPLRADCLVHLPDMRHISMHCELSNYHNRLNITMKEYLAVVVDKCLSLRTFTLHLQPLPQEGARLISLLKPPKTQGTKTQGTYNPGPTFAALLKLPNLERLTILAPRPRCDPQLTIPDEDNGLGIAPNIQWVRALEKRRGDELADITEVMYARAIAALRISPLRYVTHWSHQSHEELMTWTSKPREERMLQRAREQTQKQTSEMEEFMERLGVRPEGREGGVDDEQGS